jgi:DNA-binding MarR family transcriptional regulator
MERTTLTRNLGPLERAKLIVKAASDDRRERLLCLSAEGKRKLRASYAIWESVQSEFVRRLGAEGFGAFEKALGTAENVAESILNPPRS